MSDAQMTYLRRAVEQRLSFPLSTSRDFDTLSDMMTESGAGYLSSSTLKRIWGYVRDTPRKNQSTLDVLARFVGFPGGCAEFISHFDKITESESGFDRSRVLNVLQLPKGALVETRWIPGREMTLRHEGDCNFTVESAVNTKLQAGSRVRCVRFVEGLPLSLDIIDASGRCSLIYQAGKIHGITWKLLEPPESQLQA